ncbi:probable ATP-dependent RNA helicase DDX10 [Rhinichthys klamathensis goyatoka]|uniref:probable ATP-dependent RNA helicase DDX10 n=1 Tax=Rhinichthys klamathensis goyatoka TaxID=3034132 RepID=UPI0024B5A412|nr:probable ATP-dependent RNA helicase DDX10 [Rhinichthys klamathensis goyatoka]
MREKNNKEKKKVTDDPVKNFEKWKKKYDKTKTRVKRAQQTTRKKRDWEVERENIQRLVNKYSEINSKEAVKFSDFPLSKKTLKGLLVAQYRQPTEIQRQTIGFALRGKDVLGAAKTGSGKTLAFLIPVLECLYREQWTADDGLGALIISPTRELAYQTFEVLRKIGKNHEFSAGLIIGGKDLKGESEKIHRTNIIICTPGRLLQHMDETSTFHASNLHMLVLDEADRILDMGFADTLNAIVENLPKTRQTLLFSATQTRSVKDLARLSLKDPEYVSVHEQAKFSTPATLEQNYVVCELHQKINMLFSFLRSHLQKKIIVFFACCKEVQYLFRVFCRLRPGISVLALHGKQQQMKRVEVYNDFVRKTSAVLFATDIAARGLDFPAVNWVLQFDCPEDANTYIHRVGRAARYKEEGEALLVLLPSEEKGMIAQLQEKKVPINKIQVNPEKLVSVQQKLEAFLAQEMDQKERAQRCFVSYLRSVYLMKNKDVFDVFQLKLPEYAMSMGLAVAPRVRFLSKTQQQKSGGAQDDSGAAGHESEDELQSFKAKLEGQQAESQSSQSEEEEEEEEEETLKPAALLCGFNEEEEDDDLDLLTVKRKDVFNTNEESQDDEGSDANSKNNKQRESKFKDAKKIHKRNLKVNTKKIFTEEGKEVQQWPPLQRTMVPDEEEDEEISGINVEAAKERLRREDQEFDKIEYRRKIQEKHREKRLKEKAARREANKQQKEEKNKAAAAPDDDDEDEDEEVVAYLSGADEEFDPSSLPDPDKVCESESSSKEDGDSSDHGGRKRSFSSDSSEDDDGDVEVQQTQVGRKKPRKESTAAPLDTGLSLAEDEELVLHLLGSRS